jgi:hypothetical protein
MLVDLRRIQEPNRLKLPFGYYVERDPDLLVLRCSDGSFVAAFSARGVDPFEIELTVWEEAN